MKKKPTRKQLSKFRRINRTPHWLHGFVCMACDDCSVCSAAIHQGQKHTCTRGISEEKFRALMSSSDCEY